MKLSLFTALFYFLRKKKLQNGQTKNVLLYTPNCNNVVIEKKQKAKSQIGMN